MNKQQNEAVFNSFVQKAQKRLEEKKVRKYRTLYVPSLDQNIKIRNLDYPEIMECTEIDDSKDANKSDKYSIYLAVVEPDLIATAQALKEQGAITEYTDVVDIFELTEITEIAMEVMRLSGVTGGKKVVVVDELKN